MSDNGSDGFLIAVWAVSFTTFVLLPFCVSRYRRRLCLARIRERRWNVYVEPERDDEWYRLALERYEAYRAELAEAERQGQRDQLSLEAEDEVRRVHLLDRMQNYTLVLSADDIKVESSKSTIQKTTSSDLEAGGNDCNISGADEDSHGDDLQEMMGEEDHGWISVPLAGTRTEGAPTKMEENIRRDVVNGCPICLCNFEIGDRVTWASNMDCKHVFHENCALDWMMSVGRKRALARRRNEDDSVHYEDPIEAAVTFPKLCPVCRRDFVIEDHDAVPVVRVTTDETLVIESELVDDERSRSSSQEANTNTDADDAPSSWSGSENATSTE